LGDAQAVVNGAVLGLGIQARSGAQLIADPTVIDLHGTRTLLIVYVCSAVLIGLTGLGLGGSSVAVCLFIGAMLCLGAGNGALFQLVPQRFGKELGVMTGLIGMAGGVGGFALAAGLGMVKQTTGNYSLGLWLFSFLSLIAWYGLSGVKVRWRSALGGDLAQARI
ncbi:MAG: hypothetical protein K2Q15_15625, partial [Burkholderiales bacterium]|nr:hypothetical protein [Burkholderiales bacterium]